jgi:hypothetical protein
MRFKSLRLCALVALLVAGCATASSPSVVGIGDIGTGLWVERRLGDESAFYLCHPHGEPEIRCRVARVQWIDEPREHVPFEPAPPETDETSHPSPEPQQLAPPPEGAQ